MCDGPGGHEHYGEGGVWGGGLNTMIGTSEKMLLIKVVHNNNRGG